MGVEPPVANPVITTDELARLQVTASRVFVHHAIVDYVVRVVLATRTPRSTACPTSRSGCPTAPARAPAWA